MQSILIKAWYITLSSLLLLSSCVKTDAPKYALDSTMLTYVPDTRLGNYWVYRNTKSGREDSMYVSYAYRGSPNCRGKDCIISETINYEYQSRGNCWMDFRADNNTPDRRTQVSISNSAEVDMKSLFVLGKNNNQLTVVGGSADTISSLKVNGVTYQDVLLLVNKNKDSLYLVQKIGMVKASMGCLGDIELLRYRVR